MTLYDPRMNSEFHQFATLQMRRHRLLMAEQDDDPAMDSIDDEMTVLWEKLDETQRQSVRGMSSDLNWIRRNGGSAPKGRQSGDVTPEDRQALVKATKENDWHALLHYLRLCASLLRPMNLAYLRAKAYQAIGLTNYSSIFCDQALKIEPGNGSIWVLAMQAVEREDPEKARQRAAQTLESPLTHPPVAVAMSAAMILRGLEEENGEIDRAYYAKLLQETVDRLNLELPPESERAMVFQLAASAFEIMNDLPKALHYYEEGLKMSPENEVLLVGIGLLLYGSQTKQATEAFLRAVKKQTPLVWPYFFLAHYYVRDRQYDNSLQMGRLAWERAATNPVRAEILEWQAICLSELSYPGKVVRSIFEEATVLDPENRSIRTNFEAFLDAEKNVGHAIWEIEEERRLRVERAPKMSQLELTGIA